MEINEEQSDYVDDSEKGRDRMRTKLTPHSGGRLYRLGALTLGLMCILQATLNVSLRLILYNDLMEEREQLHASFIKLQSYKNVTEERDQLRMENGRLNERIKMLGERPCPQGWTRSGSSCYYTSTEWNSWEYSRQDCLSRGAHLVIINSKDEQTFINGYVDHGRYVWIGLTDNETESSWTWVDGTPMTTEHWGTGQPDNKGDQDCVVASGQQGGWHDEGCTIEFFWVCEK